MEQLLTALLVSALSGGDPVGMDVGKTRDYTNLKIVPPPDGGLYIGQYEWQEGDIETFEQAAGRKVAWGTKQSVIDWDHDGHPLFDAQSAERAWQKGMAVVVEAYEAYPNPDDMRLSGFTVDKLLQGEYDVHLSHLAKAFLGFGKPMIFNTAREPNGIGSDYFGGFGPKGDKSLLWALQNRKGFAEFDPSGFPNQKLYAGLGDPNVSDGLERLIAAQRYYYDFFVRKKNLAFLTFDTMGWAVHGPEHVAEELREMSNDIDKVHARKLLESCYDFAQFYPGDRYVDWVSITFYTLDFYAKDWKGLEKDFMVPNETYSLALKYTMNKIRKVAHAKPVFFLELGFPDGISRNSNRAANRISTFFTEITSQYPEIHGYMMWSFHPSWEKSFPYDSLIRPGTSQANALRGAIGQSPRKFHSCVYFSDGSQIPVCQDTAGASTNLSHTSPAKLSGSSK